MLLVVRNISPRFPGPMLLSKKEIKDRHTDLLVTNDQFTCIIEFFGFFLPIFTRLLNAVFQFLVRVETLETHTTKQTFAGGRTQKKGPKVSYGRTHLESEYAYFLVHDFEAILVPSKTTDNRTFHCFSFVFFRFKPPTLKSCDRFCIVVNTA